MRSKGPASEGFASGFLPWLVGGIAMVLAVSATAWGFALLGVGEIPPGADGDGR